MSSLKEKIQSPKQKILNDLDVKDTLRRLHDDFVLVPADKAAKNVIVIETLIKKLGINTTNISPNSTYIPSTDSFVEILKSHCKFIESVGLEMSEEDKNLPYLYWTPKLSKVLTTVKDGLIRYNNTKTSRNRVNSMWIVKNSTGLFSSLDQLECPYSNISLDIDFSTLYTSIPNSLELLHLYTTQFNRRNGSNRCTHIKIMS